MESGSEKDSVVQRIRKVADGYLRGHQMGSAVFWSGQAMSLGGNQPEDVLRLAECLIVEKQYHRALQLIRSHKLEANSLNGCHLAAKAAYECGELDDAVLIVENAVCFIDKAKADLSHSVAAVEAKKSSVKATRSVKSLENILDSDETIAETRKAIGSMYLLRGSILEAKDNREQAAEAYREAVRVDVFCHEAFKALIRHQILTAAEETELIEAMPFDEQCMSKSESDLVRFLHEMSLKKYNKPSDLFMPKNLEAKLCQNSDFTVAKAERHFYNCDYIQCFRLTSSVMKDNSFHSDCLPIHICCLVELCKSNDLFHLAHKLVDLYPDWVVAWFAVGCYYYMISKHELARRYLNKATLLDRVFGPAWLAYGHSFALENEHDQAMAAYFKAFQLMKGCHLPLLYIGVEYGLTNNPKLAEQFFTQALDIAPNDPFVLHEMGVTCYQNQDYGSAEKYFMSALQQVKSVQGSVVSSKWESLLNNLGHTERKLGRFDASLDFHQQALVLLPMSYSTYSAIGYVQALRGDLVEAVEAFHKALSLKRDDAFSSKMLNSIIEQLVGEATPYQDYPDEVPKLEPLDTATSTICIPRSSFAMPSGNASLPLSSQATSTHTTEDDSNVNLSSSLDVEMADVTNNE